MTDAELEALASKPTSAQGAIGSVTNRSIAELIQLQKHLERKAGTGRSIGKSFVEPPGADGIASDE